MRFGVEPTSFLLPAWASRRRWHGADSAALIVASCTFLVLALGSAAHAQAVRESTWVTDGTVNAIAGTGSTLFLGGTFSRVGPWVGGAGVVDRGTGSAVKPYPRVAGTVFASTADGAAGWYIGGAFTRVQG